jgi:hypothetical protein
MPQVIADVCAAQDLVREQVRRAATIIRLATPLHIVATANMTPSFRAIDGIVRPVRFYTMALSEFAVSKLSDRGSLAASARSWSMYRLLWSTSSAGFEKEKPAEATNGLLLQPPGFSHLRGR